MNKQQFFQRYGKIKVRDKIQERHPVTNIKVKDVNRQLMIKFKYSNLTQLEQFQFHENIKKLIYKVMHSNNVLMDWDDVYQQIWKKIIRCRHTWNQSKGTMVSTWITIVANSVINTLRQSVNKYRSRYCLYDDICSSSDEDNESSDREKCDFVQFLNNNSDMLDKTFEQNMFKEKYMEFWSTLNECEKMFMMAVNDMQDSFLNAYDRKVRIPHNDLKSKLGYDDSTYNTIIYNIRRKYCVSFNKKFQEFNAIKVKDKNEFLF